MKLDQAVKNQLEIMLERDDEHFTPKEVPETEVSYLLRAFIAILTAYLQRVGTLEEKAPETPLRGTIMTQG